RGVRCSAALLRVTARASLLAHETFARHFLPRTKIGQVGYLLLTRLRSRNAGKLKQAQSAMTEGKQASYWARKHGSPVSTPGGSSFQIVPVIDRKSTRLNSSHGSISYAVFC